ncbi:MAG: DDE-type integrase/transposase/recombinase [Caldilineaceae bacterium]|nr:DDE-type integrase/transposase/recombinase [Caldilineaceae bacterium]
MTATDTQVRILMRERRKGRTQEQAAAKANLSSRNTVRKYEALGQLPSQLRQPRRYRTRPDEFAADWPRIEQMLRDAPELEAKALFEWLCTQEPERYHASQLRTFQRRVAVWRGLNQPQVATLEQIHEPGELMELDGVWLTELDVTIAGQPFKHMLIHCVLSYSNWEWGRVVQSESLGAVRLGLQSSLAKLGYVPRVVQTDNSSAATRRLGIQEGREGGAHGYPESSPHRAYTLDYLHLLDHYGMEAQTIHVANPNENADVESSHGTLLRALKQELLRGSREFDTIESYETFVWGIMDKRNRTRQERLAEEIAVMKPLKATPLATSVKHKVRVSSGSLIQALHKTYSVPTSLIGKEVTIYVHEWSLDVYYAGQLVDTLPRLIGQKTHQVNYRHLIDTLLRKPGGFRRYRFRDDLFPQLIFRRAWEQLNEWHPPRRADLIYLRVLHLAARTLESDVAAALTMLVARGQPWDEQDVA